MEHASAAYKYNHLEKRFDDFDSKENDKFPFHKPFNDYSCNCFGIYPGTKHEEHNKLVKEIGTVLEFIRTVE